MQPKIELPEIASDPLGTAGAVTEAEIDRRLQRAAALVEDFADTTALTALDACLAAARGPGALPARLADDLCKQTALLQDEIERFLGRIDDCRET
jgi:hypothetical protein